ncbi:MAG: gamma-glutamyltransferase [Chloroflexi bacterium]|nr:gamma-glutamyltransferase [Chloroflexota bacterium]
MTRNSPHGQVSESHRPVVMGRRGMVCAGHPLAAEAGVRILRQGGNAVDAAIAVAASLNVVEPMMSGIGGDGFIMVYSKAEGRVRVVNATGPAGQEATRERYARDGIPQKGALSVSVPALLHGWLDAHEAIGRLSLGAVLAPAIELAAEGFPVSHYLAGEIAADPLLCQFPTSRAVFADAGEPLRPGQILRQSDLAKTLAAIAEDGRAVFYEGSVGERMVSFIQEQGGLLTMRDLAACSARWQDPIWTSYRGHRVCEAPPNSSGHVLLQELAMLDQFDLEPHRWDSAESIHLMVEAKKLAFVDREAFLADPDYVEVPIEGLISREYARFRAGLIDRQAAAGEVAPGDPWAYQDAGITRRRPRLAGGMPDGEDTTCFVVVDSEGNAVSQLQSLQSAWGSSLIAGDTGILLNNRMTYWHLDPDHVDCLAPGKRVRHTMNPVMVFAPSDDGAKRLRLVLGTPGADTQVQANLQVISHVLDFGMSVAEAVEAPRWKDNQSPLESAIPHECDDELLIEARFPEDTVRGLSSLGHRVRVLESWAGVTGREMMIEIDQASGALMGAADPRFDGYAMGR